MSSTTPDQIGPYDILRPLARGGMAEVYEVQDRVSGERFALKMLQETKGSTRRFNREFEALTRLNHPSIVRVFHYGFFKNHPWITMELLEGTVLQDRVKAFGPPGTHARTQEVIRAGYLIANALGYIHDRGLVHRDLKSANVQVLADGRIKLLDFGTAHLVEPIERITNEGDFVGTFSYAAPEQIAGGAVDWRADLYALGILLYRLATGRRPFKSEKPEELAHMHLYVAPRRPREHVPELPQRLEDLILQLMAKKRRDRPRSAYDVAKELEAVSDAVVLLPGAGLAVDGGRSLGREREHRELWRRIEGADSGTVFSVISGEDRERASFVAQLLRDAPLRDATPVRLDAAGGLPSLAASLSDVARGLDREALAAHGERVTHAVEVLRNLDAVGERDLVPLLRETGTPVLQAMAAQHGRFVLVFSEGHRLPPESFPLLSSWKRALSGPGMTAVLVAVCDEAGDGGMWDLGGEEPERLALEPLSVETTALAVGALLHRRPPPAEVARRIHEVTGGQPAWIEDLVTDMVTAGRIEVRSDDGNRLAWSGADRAHLPLPASVLHDVERRLSKLPIAHRRVLEALEIAGGEANTRILSAGLEMRRAEVAALLPKLLVDGWVSYTGDADSSSGMGEDPVRSTEPLFLAVVGERMEPARRRLVQDLLLGPMLDAPPSAAQVRLLLACQAPAEAMRRAVVAARQLAERDGPGGALDLLHEVIVAGDGIDVEGDVRAELHLMRAEALRLVRPTDPEAGRSLAAAARSAESYRLQARVEYARAAHQGTIGHYANFRKYLLQAWALLETGADQALASRVARDLAWSHVWAGEMSKATGWFDRAVETAHDAGHLELASEAEVGLAECVLARGEVERAEKQLAALRTRCERSGNPGGALAALSRWAECLRRQGRMSEALPELHRHAQVARLGRDPALYLRLLLATARSELELFRLGSAQESIDELASIVRPGEHLHIRLEVNLTRGRILVASGQVGAASRLLREVIDQATRAELVVLANQAKALLGETVWMMGQSDEGRKLFQASFLALAAAGDQCALADAATGWARAVGATEDPTRPFRLIKRLDDEPTWLPLRLELCLAEFRWHREQRRRESAHQNLREAAALLNRIATGLTEIDRAAMRVHPWTQEIRRAMGKSPKNAASGSG